MRGRPERIERFQFVAGGFAVLPLPVRFDKIQPVFGIIGRKLDGLFQPFARFVPAADAHRPAGRVAIQQAETARGAGVIEMFIQVARRFELVLHFLHHFEGCQVSPGVRQLAEFDGQVIMSRDRIGFVREQLPARGDALIGQFGAPGVVRDEIIEVITRAGKLPGGRGVVGVR